MAITFSDNINLPVPKSIRTTDIVGTGVPASSYATKEDIPMYMRYLYMTITDDGGFVWRLEDAFDFTVWTQQLNNTSSAVSHDIEASVDAGGILIGDTVYQGTDITALVEQLIAPLVLATVKTQNSVVLQGIATEILEVGFLFVDQLSTAYNKGLIKSQDGHPDVTLTGAATGSTFSGNGVGVTGDISTPVLEGSNFWGVIESFAVGTDPYYDSEGNVATNLDAQRGPGTVSDNSNIITGKYRYWISTGTIPTSSVGVRALVIKGYFPITTFEIDIFANTAEVAFYIPVGESIQVQYKESSYADVTATFIEVVMNVNDGGGIPQSYSRFETTIPGGGYPSNATYIVTIL